MAKIVLIGCSAAKSPGPVRARDLYQGTLFKKSLAFAEKRLKPKAIFVLSAKYGLVPLDRKLTCYDQTLNAMPAAERKAWAGRVFNALEKETDVQKDTFVLFAGRAYCQYLVPRLAHVELPLAGRRIGEQLALLSGGQRIG